jgi:hypothetical protein
MRWPNQTSLIYVARNLTVQLLRRRALFLCRQEDTKDTNIKNIYVNNIGQTYFKHPLAYNTIDLSPIMKKNTQKINSAIFSYKESDKQ